MKISVRRSKGNKKVRNATRLEVGGIKFRSKLEAFTYSKLIEAGITDFDYEKDKFVLQEAFEYPEESFEMYQSKKDGHMKRYFEDVNHNIRSMTYLPDFTRINHETKLGWILEVKGYATNSFDLKWKLFKKYLVLSGYKATLYKPDNQGNVLKTINLIKNKYYGGTTV